MKPNLTAVTGAALALTCLSTAHAGPAAYVHTPAVEYGETELELHGGTRREPGEARESAAVISVGYGVTPYWFTEIEKKSGEGAEVEALEWENILQLTEPGQYAVDLGMLVEVEASLESDGGWELKLGPLLQTEFGKTQVNFNPLLERKFDTDGEEKTELVYEWQVLYRLQQSLEFGLQGLGEVGEWNDWEDSSDQNHKAGPVIAGKLPLGNHDAIKYDAALLFGLNSATADNTVRFSLEYEF